MRPDHRLPTTDYETDSGIITNEEAVRRGLTTDHRPLTTKPIALSPIPYPSPFLML